MDIWFMKVEDRLVQQPLLMQRKNTQQMNSNPVLRGCKSSFFLLMAPGWIPGLSLLLGFLCNDGLGLLRLGFYV